MIYAFLFRPNLEEDVYKYKYYVNINILQDIKNE